MAKKPTGQKPGRKSWRTELRMSEVGKLCSRSIMNALQSDELTIEDKAKLAMPIYCKMLPKEVKLNSESTIKVEITAGDKVYTIESGVDNIEPIQIDGPTTDRLAASS